MCEKAEEIQEYYRTIITMEEINVGDFYHDNDTKENTGGFSFEIASEDNEYGQPICHKNIIWLPRQDQLQEILIGEDANYDNRRDDMFMDFYTFWIKISGRENFNYCDKYERYWLAFIMDREYNKEWNNDLKEWKLID